MKSLTKALLLVAGFLMVFGLLIGYKILTEPQNLRFSSDSVQPQRMFHSYKRCSSLNLEGLREANFSGSGSLVRDHLQHMKDHLGTKIKVVNGTDELTQTTFYKGRTLYFLCMNYDGKYITQHAIRNGLNCYAKRLINGTPLNLEGIQPTHLSSEKQLMEQLHIPYSSILPLDFTSNWDYMDELVELFEQTNTQDTHILFHCTRGQGRTTTLMTLYDIFRNHKRASFEEIVNRQYCLGGEDLMDTTHRPKGTWKHDALVNRLHLVHAFYDYMSDKKGYGYQSMTQWMRMKKEENYGYLPMESDQGSPYRNGTRA